MNNVDLLLQKLDGDRTKCDECGEWKDKKTTCFNSRTIGIGLEIIEHHQVCRTCFDRKLDEYKRQNK